jgi:hypothetical protein
MTRRFTLSLIALFALAIVPALAHPGHDHKILGTVTMAAADHVMVKDKAGKDEADLTAAGAMIPQLKVSIAM